MDVPFPEALDIQNPERFKEFDFKNTVRVETRNIEGGGNSLGDVGKVATDRSWMGDFTQGGGTLYDMLIHQANLLAKMEFTNNGIQEVLLGALTGEDGVYRSNIYSPGHYRQFADQKTGEIYAYAKMLTGINGGNQAIETILECGKAAKYNDQFVRLTDPRGNVLHWEIMPTGDDGNRIPGSKLYMWNEANPDRVIATIAMGADCYALAIEQFDRFATQYHQGQRPPMEPSHFEAQRDGVFWVDDMHKVARAQTVPSGAIVKQLRILEDEGRIAPIRHLGKASFKANGMAL
jgi:hypothetical protein